MEESPFLPWPSSRKGWCDFSTGFHFVVIVEINTTPNIFNLRLSGHRR
jgi:hypothetical protein